MILRVGDTPATDRGRHRGIVVTNLVAGVKIKKQDICTYFRVGAFTLPPKKRKYVCMSSSSTAFF